MRFASSLRPWHFLGMTAVLFAAITAHGLWYEGYNSDDWRHLSGLIDLWSASEGRWVQDLLFRYVLGGTFNLPLQLPLSYLCFAAIAWLITQQTTPEPKRPVMATLIFAVGVNHIYMADALNFDSHIMAFALALLLSLVAFLMLNRARGQAGWIRPLLIGLGAAQLLALSLGIYQPFAIFGAIIPMLVLMRYQNTSLREVAVLFALCAAVSALALGLHRVEWEAVMALQGRQIVPARFETPDAANLVHKLWQEPAVALRTLQDGLLALPHWFNLAQLAFAALTAALILSVPLADPARGAPGQGARLWNLGRCAGTVVLVLAVLPTLFRFASQDQQVPPRAVAFLGFWIAALLAAGMQMAQEAGMPKTLQRLAGPLGMGALVLVAVLNMGASVVIWRDRARLSQAELAYAEQIYHAVTGLPGYAGEPIHLIGDARFKQFRWGGSMGRTVFQGDNINHGIFKESFDLPWRSIASVVGPRPCPAFPAPGSVYLHGGAAYVCMAAQSNDLLPLSGCLTSANPDIGQICESDKWLVQRLPDCTDRLRPVDVLVIRSTNRRGEEIQRVEFENEQRPFELDGACYHAHAWRAGDPGLIVEIYEMGRGTISSEVLRKP